MEWAGFKAGVALRLPVAPPPPWTSEPNQKLWETQSSDSGVQPGPPQGQRAATGPGNREPCLGWAQSEGVREDNDHE